MATVGLLITAISSIPYLSTTLLRVIYLIVIYTSNRLQARGGQELVCFVCHFVPSAWHIRGL